MPRKVGSGARWEPRRNDFIAHKGSWDLLLVRVGHHLWGWYAQAVKGNRFKEMTVYADALESVWQAKREFRAAKGKG